MAVTHRKETRALNQKRQTKTRLALLRMSLTVACFPLLASTAFANGSEGPLTAGTVTGTSWTFDLTSLKVSAETSDDNRDIYDSTSQDDLILTNFGFGIASNATITGIVVTREGHSTAANPPSNRHYQIGLTKDGSALAGTRKTGQALPKDTDDSDDIGTTSDLWGTTWTPSEINSSNFGVLISDNDTTASDQSSQTRPIS